MLENGTNSLVNILADIDLSLTLKKILFNLFFFNLIKYFEELVSKFL